MTPEQQNIEQVKEYLKSVASRGIYNTLLTIQEEIGFLQELISAGIAASTAEIHAASEKASLLDESEAEARASQSLNYLLTEHLGSIHTTLCVLTCTLAGVRNNAEACCRTFEEAKDLSIEESMVDALIRHPEHLNNAAAEIAVRQQDDNSATATLRRHLSNLLKKEGRQ